MNPETERRSLPYIKDHFENESGYEVGQDVMVFDARLWEKNGGDSNDDSFYRKAKILCFYKSNHGEQLVDVLFYHDGRASKGHFLSGVEAIHN
jgi:hypothetical protein